jgi:hypothetical protein
MSAATEAIQNLIDDSVASWETSSSLRRFILGKALRAVLDAEAQLANRVTSSDPNAVTVKFGDAEVTVVKHPNGHLLVHAPHDARFTYAPKPQPREFVGVCIDVAEFDSPAAAARWPGFVCTYEVDPALGVTVGDHVEIPAVWTAGAGRVREGIVVGLNADDPTPRVGYVKQIKSITRRGSIFG